MSPLGDLSQAPTSEIMGSWAEAEVFASGSVEERMVAASGLEQFAAVVAAVAVAAAAAEPNCGQAAGSLEAWLPLAYNLAALLEPGCYLEMKASY